MSKLVKILTALFFLLSACNSNEVNSSDGTLPVPKPHVEEPAPKDDSLAAIIRPFLTKAVQKDIEEGGTKATNLTITGILHKQLTAAAFYGIKKAELEKQLPLSSNREKTLNAINYLEKKIAAAGKEPPVYEIKFHLSARAGEINYNDNRTLYLNKNFSEVQLVFPGN